jgi:paraquat-inducible protein B
MDKLVNSPQSANTVALLEKTLENLQAITSDLRGGSGGVAVQLQAVVTDVHAVVDDLSRQIEPLASAARATLDQGQHLLKDADEATVPRLNALLEHTDSQIEPLALRLTNAIASAEAALTATTKALQDMSRATAGVPGVQQELTSALGELSSAARAMRELAEYLETHPESLLHGKGGR